MQVASSSNAPIPTCIELKTDTLVKTWNPEIFELPFTVVNPHKAREFMQYNSPPAKGYRDHAITIMMKKENGAFGLFIQPVRIRDNYLEYVKIVYPDTQ